MRGLGIAAAGYILAQVPWFQARMPFRSVAYDDRERKPRKSGCARASPPTRSLDSERPCKQVEDRLGVIEDLVRLDERLNLNSLPEVQAMRQVLLLQPKFDPDLMARLSVAAALNDYQDLIRSNPDGGSYWGPFVNWAAANGQRTPPWRRFPNVKRRRFERFRTSKLWQAKLLEMDSD